MAILSKCVLNLCLNFSRSDMKSVALVLAHAVQDDVNAPVSPRDSRSPLHLASSLGNLAIAQLLIWVSDSKIEFIISPRDFFTQFQKWRLFFCDSAKNFVILLSNGTCLHWIFHTLRLTFLANFVGRLDFCKINKGGKWKNSTILGVWAFLLCSTYCVMSNKSTQCSFFCV